MDTCKFDKWRAKNKIEPFSYGRCLVVIFVNQSVLRRKGQTFSRI